jgi:hypothetical protein
LHFREAAEELGIEVYLAFRFLAIHTCTTPTLMACRKNPSMKRERALDWIFEMKLDGYPAIERFCFIYKN